MLKHCPRTEQFVSPTAQTAASQSRKVNSAPLVCSFSRGIKQVRFPAASRLVLRSRRGTNVMIRKRYILLLGMFLCAPMLTAAQTSAPEPIAVLELVSTNIPTSLTTPARFYASSLPVSQNTGQYAASSLSTGAYEPTQSLSALSPMIEVKTLFITQSRLPLVQLWHGRLLFEGFTSELHTQNVQLGPSGGGNLQDFHPARQRYPCEPRSVYLYGVSLSFHFGRTSQAGNSTQIWRRLARIVH